MYFPALMEVPTFGALSPIRQFQILWCGMIAFSLILDFPYHVRFYRWFSNSGLEMAKVRGYGQSAGKLYGLIPAPKLSVPAMAFSGIALISSLLFACILADPRPCLAVALISYHCYISQLYAEVHVVAHNMALVPPALIVCLICPDIVAPAGEGFVAAAQQWPLFLLKFIITTAYCSAACCKITKVFTDGADWSSGATMQAVMFEAIMGLNLPSGEAAHTTFSKPTPFSRCVQRWLFRHPRIMGFMTLYGVVIELVAPLVLIFPILDIPFAVLGLGLHYGIAYLQNIDFLAWWGPFYAVFFLTDASLCQFSTAADAYVRLYPGGFEVGLWYVVIHLGGMVVHRLIPDIDMLPLSRFPMFDSPKNLWDPAQPHWAWLTKKTHGSGELMTFAFPMCRPQHVLPAEIDTLPFNYLLFGKPRPDDEGLTVHTNVVVTMEVQDILDRFNKEWQKGADKYTDFATTTAMLELVDAAKKAFAAAPRRAALDVIMPSKGAPTQNTVSKLAPKDGKTEPLLSSFPDHVLGA
jgi:hypothetical protein